MKYGGLDFPFELCALEREVITGGLASRAIVPVLVVLGWALTTIVVIGFTPLVRRE